MRPEVLEQKTAVFSFGSLAAEEPRSYDVDEPTREVTDEPAKPADDRPTETEDGGDAQVRDYFEEFFSEK